VDVASIFASVGAGVVSAGLSGILAYRQGQSAAADRRDEAVEHYVADPSTGRSSPSAVTQPQVDALLRRAASAGTEAPYVPPASQIPTVTTVPPAQP